MVDDRRTRIISPEEAEFGRAVYKRQSAEWMHPLTCGNDSTHALLVGLYVNGKPHLVCRQCEYVQSYIPPLEVIPNPFGSDDNG